MIRLRPNPPCRRALATLLVPTCLLLALPCAAADLGRAAGAQWQFEGLLQGDHTAFDGRPAGLRDDSELRRAELVLKGSRGPWDWSAGYDVSSRNDKWLDVTLRRRLGAVDDAAATAGRGHLALGQFKHYLGLEELGSSRHNDFIAKAMATSTFAIGRRLGLGASWSAGPWWLGGSGFGRELGSDGARGNGVSVRAAWAPWQEEGRIVHLGLSGLDRSSGGDSARWRSRAGFEPALLPSLVDTGTVSAVDRIRTLGLEAAWAPGPLKLQGEYLAGRLRRGGQEAPAGDTRAVPDGDFRAHGWYLSGLWNLSGDAWRYRNGIVGPIPPDEGASVWQLAARLEGLDLDDGGYAGGHARVLTLGGNWYWGRHLKLSLNHVRSQVRQPDRSALSARAVVARLQLHW